MRNLLLGHRPEGLYNGGYTGLVVAAQNGIALAADNAVLYDRDDTLTGDHRIHMGAEDQTFSLDGAGERAVEVAGIAAGEILRVVPFHLAADGFQIGGQPKGKGLFVGAFTVDLDIVQEGGQKPLVIDHSNTSFTVGRKEKASRMAVHPAGGSD